MRSNVLAVCAIALFCSGARADATLPPGVLEREITVTAAPGTLSGTLATKASAKPVAAVVIVAGSGPTDRNGNSALGLNPDTYRLLAYGLAANGIAALRADKRGIGKSAGAMTRESDLRVDIYADDVRLWVASLKHETGLPRVWLLGHSEGGLISELAAKDNADVCGLVLVAAPGRTLGDVLRAQLAAVPEPQRTAIYGAIASLEAGHGVQASDRDALFRPSVQPYLMSEIALDPAALLKALAIPVLILQGDADVQITPADANLLAAARPDAKLVILNGVDHELKVGPFQSIKDRDAGLPIAPGTVDAISTFVRMHRQ
jgi:pimeloyl-ACP methyl ester carboxylesterase